MADRDPPACELLQQAFACALEAANAARGVALALARVPQHGPALVLGAGKAAAAMALSFRTAWRGPLRGLVVTRYGHGLLPGEQASPIEVIEAAHPLPDAQSVVAGTRLLALARSVHADETLWFLASGGGSALCALPLPGVTMADKRAAADFLIRSGADIRAINCVRKHLSAVKGGRLAAAAHPARVHTLVVSDVPGDHLEDVASGPTLPDATCGADALAVLRRYGYPGAGNLEPLLTDPAFESPKPAAAEFAHDEVELIASPAAALAAAQEFLAAQGFRVLCLGDDLGGAAAALGREHARLARREARMGGPVAILSGGETTVELGAASGRGGRNLEYLAGLALELAGEPGIYALAADTDGYDGHGDHAGGIVLPELLSRGAGAGLELADQLAQHDTYRYFDACRLLVRTGPTRTNVNDFRLILCQS